MMKPTEQTLLQIERALRKTAEKFPEDREASMMTDIHIRVNQDSGELMTFDDEDEELTRCVVEQWIDNKDDDFYDSVATTIRRCIDKLEPLMERLSILKPYSYVLEDEEGEPLSELYVADDDTVIIDPVMMDDLEKDLDDFLDNLLKS